MSGESNTNSATAVATATAAGATATVTQAPVPTAVLENLATRFRPSGLCLMMLRTDGTVAYADGACNLFFQRYALPLIQYSESAAALSEKVTSLTAKSPVEIWNLLPGVVLAA